jgi:parallel beta-helix repeat protein
MITPTGGLFSGPVSVTMQTATSGASIYYTTDGSTPTQSSAPYTGIMTLTSSATVKTTAFKSGYNRSAEATASFTISAATAGSSMTGKTYYVAKNGNDSNSCAQAQSSSTPMRSIKRGITCLATGDTLLIRSGNYDERIVNYQTTIASGTSFANPVTIAAYPGEAVWLTPTVPSSAAIIDFSPNVPNQYIIFDGINVDGTNVTGGNSAITPGGTRIRFQNLEVKNTGNGLTSGSGFSVYGSFNEFINLDVHDNGKANDFLYNLAAGYGFYIGGSDNLVERSRIHHNGGYGIHIYHTSGSGADRNIIRYNQIFDNSTAAQQETSDILLSSGDGNKAYGNLLYRTTFKAATRGISAVGSNPAVYNNTIYNYGYGGISTSGSTNAVVRNNIIYGNGTSGQTANTEFSNSPGLIADHNLVLDPKFTAAGSDFRLQSGSPAIDTGVTIDGISFDITGTNRPQGAAYDLGAFEYH